MSVLKGTSLADGFVQVRFRPGLQWHTLRVEFAGSRIKVIFNGKPYLDLQDEHIAGTGAVGVWTKADSVTSFDNFTYSRP